MDKVLSAKNADGFAYAGFSTKSASDTLFKVRKSYVRNAYKQALVELEEAKKAKLAEREREELLLIDAKLDLRIWEVNAPSDKTLLERAKRKFEAFLRTSTMPLWRSEARGWLARTHYLLGEYSSAVKIYIDELDKADTIFTKESVVSSLHMIFPYNGSSLRLVDHLEEYFDTPAHALFVVYLVTNPVYSDARERANMSRVAQKTIDALQKHKELFIGDGMSDALALALMRAAIYNGDTQKALLFSRKIRKKSATADSVEFNWMVASCYFLQRDYKAAEEPLLKIAHSKTANPSELRLAAQGLIGVYHKLKRRVDQLHSAFLYEKVGDKEMSENSGLDINWGWLVDLSYLLDVQLADDELKEYLVRYGKVAKQIKRISYKRPRTAYEMVEYALAVRYARLEKFDEAAELYEKLNAKSRAHRMRILADLYKKTNDAAMSSQDIIEAQYRYASFLEEHPNRIFFNDMVWYGFQSSMFLGDSAQDRKMRGLTKKEQEFYIGKERKLRDDQEERWRAYKILVGVVENADNLELRRRAAIKAIRCLDFINTERFGRKDEIDSAKKELVEWVGKNKSQH
ncbi:MAG: hypothetical protein EPN22_14195 [Nitrospirae bacterium]|nr:MAG: hypothetical protein EPN22_14195 [Nitrospirota bacterium]